jgi:hypothetical protein
MVVEYKDLPPRVKAILNDYHIRKAVTVHIGTEHNMPPSVYEHSRVIYHAILPDGTNKVRSGSFGGGNPWDTKEQAMVNKGGKVENLPPGIQILRIVSGGYKSASLYVHPDFMAKALPEPTGEISWALKVVLVATRSLKSSYAGIPDYRKHEAMRETGITASEFDAAREEAIKRGFLRTNKSITAMGRNAIADCKAGSGLWTLRRADIAG